MPLGVGFFSGWLGYGVSFSSLELMEPADSGYARRPVYYGPLDCCVATDISVGSIGPAATTWIGLSFVGLYDALNAGNLLAVMPLSPPRTVQVGMTSTDFRRFTFRLSSTGGNPEGLTWIAGAELGRTDAGLPVVTGCNVQVSGGVLSAIGAPASALSLSSLPAVAPPSGSGLLWNNGGVICVA